jgi:hypothetical protein
MNSAVIFDNIAFSSVSSTSHPEKIEDLVDLRRQGDNRDGDA